MVADMTLNEDQMVAITGALMAISSRVEQVGQVGTIVQSVMQDWPRPVQERFRWARVGTIVQSVSFLAAQLGLDRPAGKTPANLLLN
jgi:hypothetical protein